jgi:hypothetical protein
VVALGNGEALPHMIAHPHPAQFRLITGEGVKTRLELLVEAVRDLDVVPCGANSRA